MWRETRVLSTWISTSAACGGGVVCQGEGEGEGEGRECVRTRTAGQATVRMSDASVCSHLNRGVIIVRYNPRPIESLLP